MVVDLLKVDGTWLVDDSNVAEDPGTEGGSTAVPSPSASPSTSPSPSEGATP